MGFGVHEWTAEIFWDAFGAIKWFLVRGQDPWAEKDALGLREDTAYILLINGG